MNKYYKTTIILEVLSTYDLGGMELNDIIWNCNEGDLILASFASTDKALTRKEMDYELTAAGSDPSFFEDER